MNATKEAPVFAWDKFGFGPGPFRYLAMFSFPSPSLAETNTDAYNNALADVGSFQRHFGVLGGSCDLCGMSLVHNYIFESSTGRRFVVGCDCAARAGIMTTQAEIDAKRTAAAAATRLRNAQKRAEEIAFLDSVSALGFVDLETVREMARRAAWLQYKTATEARQAAEVASAETDNRWLIDVIRAMPGDFISAMYDKLKTQELSQKNFSPRTLSILSDIYAKTVGGRRNSKKYVAAYDEFWDRVVRSPE